MTEPDYKFPEDAVIMAINGTDNEEVSDWWIRAFEVVFSSRYPYLESQLKDVTNYLSHCVDYAHNNPNCKW